MTPAIAASPKLTRRGWLRAASALGAAPLVGAQQVRPNVVLIVSDDLGASDLSAYGCPDIRTPNIDRIGEQGVRFTQSYSNGPECSPTRSALMTGRYQQRVGGLECAIGIGNVGRYDEADWLAKRGELGLPAEETSIAHMLKTAGYDTACMGKWHLGYGEKFRPMRHGFDEYFGVLGGSTDYFRHVEPDGTPVLYHNDKRVEQSGYITDLLANRAIAWLQRPRQNPYFLYLPFTAPHAPFQGPGDAGKKLTADTWGKGDRATYVRMVQRLDENVGCVLQQLDRMPRTENTLVVFISDNGGHQLARNAPFRGRKGSVWEGGIRVPMLMRWPKVFRAGATCDQVAITMDLAPTFLAAAGAAPPAGRRLDGVDLLPALSGERQRFGRTLFWRAKRAQRVRWAVRDGDLKYVREDAEEGLFDLARDPEEKTDLLASKPELAAELRNKLAAWEREVEAPRLREFHRGAASKA